jgi:hypothetical protein
MSMIPHFVKYAAAFEEAYASDDWSQVAPFFTDAAVYEARLPVPLGGRFEGPAAILAYFKFVLDNFDRRFASREIGLVSGPREEGDSVSLRGFARYVAPGVPDLYFELDMTVWLDGDRIHKMEDRYDAATIADLETYLRDHGAKLGIALS